MQCELIDYMGSDERIVDAARVSFDKVAANYTVDQNRKLIKYLATHGHWTPFSHVVITLRETIPIFVARQRFKHTVGFTYNEISRRYVDDTPDFYYPDTLRAKAENRKQGSSEDSIDPGIEQVLLRDYNRVVEECLGLYEDMLRNNVAPEQARMVLPQSMYTSYYCTGSLAAWSRAYLLRSEENSQKEIRNLASQWYSIISGIPEIEYSWRVLTKTVDNANERASVGTTSEY